MNNYKVTSSGFFTFLCVCQPILAVYRSPVSGFDLGTFFILLAFPFMLAFNKWRGLIAPNGIAWVLIYAFLCTFFCFISNEHFYSSQSSVINRTLRYVILLFIIICFGMPNFFSWKKYISYLRTFSLLVSGYAILQYVMFYVLHIKLPNTFGPVKQGGGGAVPEFILDPTYRPPSIFLEPSAAAYYLTPFLCYILFFEGLKSRRGAFSAIVVTLGILCTTSGQGLFVLILCWGVWYLRSMKDLNYKQLIIGVLGLALILTYFDLSFTIDRIFTNDEMNAIDARSGGYEMIKKLPIENMIVGNGYGNYDETVYYSSFAEIIFCTGFTGLVLVIVMYLRAFHRGNLFQKMLVLSSFILMSGGGIYTATFLCFYLPLIFFDKWNKKLSSIYR